MPSNPTRNQVTKTVGKGQAHAMKQGKRNAEKVQASADKLAKVKATEANVHEAVARLARAANPGEWVTTKHVAVGDQVNPMGDPDRGEYRTVASIDTDRISKTFHFTDGTKAGMGHATKVWCKHAEPTSAEVAEAITEPQPQPAATRAERLKLAKAEHALLQQWITDGSNPPRPATPNLDAVEAEANGSQPRAKATKATERKRPERTARYTEALAAKKAGARGKGQAITDPDLDAYIAKVLQADPGADRHAAMEIAYWLDKLAFSRPRWQAAWARVLDAKAAAA